MATVKQVFEARDFIPASTNGPQHKVVDGTNFPVSYLAFDAATEETAYVELSAQNYGSGNVTVTYEWVADTASSGDVIWGNALAAVTPNTDSDDVETKAFATAQTATDTHLGTTGQRLHSVDVTISTNLDSLAAGDSVWLKVYRDADAAGDTMAGDALLRRVIVSYSDT